MIEKRNFSPVPQSKKACGDSSDIDDAVDDAVASMSVSFRSENEDKESK